MVARLELSGWVRVKELAAMLPLEIINSCRLPWGMVVANIQSHWYHAAAGG